MRQDWNTYSSRLKHYGYTEEQLEEIKKIREEHEPMSFEQFTFLFQQKVVQRTRKLKKPRNLSVCPEGKIWYLNHRNRRYEWIGFFPNETENKNDE